MPEFLVTENRDAGCSWSRMWSEYDKAIREHSFGRGGQAESARERLERMAESLLQSPFSWEEAQDDTERPLLKAHSGSATSAPDLPTETAPAEASLATSMGRS